MKILNLWTNSVFAQVAFFHQFPGREGVDVEVLSFGTTSVMLGWESQDIWGPCIKVSSKTLGVFIRPLHPWLYTNKTFLKHKWSYLEKKSFKFSFNLWLREGYFFQKIIKCDRTNNIFFMRFFFKYLFISFSVKLNYKPITNHWMHFSFQLFNLNFTNHYFN